MKTWKEFKNIDEGRGDEAMAVELMLFMQNNSQLYRRRIQPIQKNLVTKMARDQYDSKKAIKAWMYAVEDGIKMYNKEYGDMPWDKDTKMAVAELMANEFEEEAELGNYDHLLPKKYQVKEARSVPLVSRGQGTSRVDTHPSDAERLYQAKDKKEYEKLMDAGVDAMAKGLIAKFGIVGDYKKFTVNIKFKDAKSRKKFERTNKIEESVQVDEMSAKAHYKKYQNKFIVPPIDRERHPNREKEGLEGPYRSKKSGKIFYYDKKAGKYYDTETDMYLAVSDVMESALNELRKDVFCIVDRKGKVLAANLDRKQSHKEADKHKNVTIVLDPDAKVGDTLSYFAEAKLLERDAYSFEPDPKIKKGIESGKFPMVNSAPSHLGGNSVFGVFQFTGKAAGGGPEPGEKQGRNYVDGYVMAIVSNPKRKPLKIFAYYGSHPDKVGAITKFAKSKNLLESTLSEADDYTLAFQFTIEYDSEDAQHILGDLEKKFRKTYSGSGSGGEGFDVSFDGPERELKKVKKYVEKEFGPLINSKDTYFAQNESVELDEASKFEKMMKAWDASDDKKVMDILKSKMDPQHFGNLNTSNGGVGLLNIIAFSLKAAKGNVKKAAELTLAKYGKNHNEYKKLAMKLNNPAHQKGAIDEDSPTNNVGGGEIAAAGPGDLPPGKTKKAKNHGCEVFTVDSETFQKCVARRKSKNERWNKFLNLESEIGKSIRKFSLRNPNKGIIIQDETTGQQVFVRRRWNDSRLKHNRSK